MSYTPGPWLASGHVIRLANREVLFTQALVEAKERSWAEVAANTKLGAAAPDLLKALEQVATGMWHTRACAALVEPESEEPCYCDQEIAKAAIAKAKGITAPPASAEED